MKILLTEGSSTSARTTLYALGGRHQIDVLDPSPFCQCRFSRFVRRWYRCPSYSKDPAGYLTFLKERLRKGGYDVLFPTHEQVYLLARVRDELSNLVGLAVPEFDVLDRVQSKVGFIELLRELGLPHPPTVIIRDPGEVPDQWQFPCFAKLAHSTAGQGVKYVHDAAELGQVWAGWVARGAVDNELGILLQQPARGEQAAVGGVFQHGRLTASHAAQLTVRGVGGAAMARISVAHPVALEHLRQLGQHLRWHGALILEYFYDPETDTPQYFEANPRIGETLNARLCGVNVCEHFLRISRGEVVLETDGYEVGVRSHQFFLMLVSLALKGASRRELCREITRCWRKTAHYSRSEDELTRPSEDIWSIIPATAVSLLLLARPGAAQWLVTRTVENYSLPDAAARKIRESAGVLGTGLAAKS